MGHDGPRADRREPSHVVAGDDDRAGADRCAFLDLDRAHDPVVHPGERALGRDGAWIPVIREDGIRPDEYPVLEAHAVVHERRVLDLDAVADPHALVDECIATDDTIGADLRTAPDLRPMPDRRPRADDDVGLEFSRWMHARGGVDHGPPR